MRISSRRRSPAAIRDAMKDCGFTLQSLASRTAEIDPSGLGVSFQLIAFLATDRPWGRETTTPASAELIARACGKQEADLFTREEVTMRGGSSQRRTVRPAA